MQVRIGLIATVVAAVFGSLCSTAFAVTPGWECVPTTAGQAVTSGGTGTSPSCGSSSTPVLAPTYEAVGVGNKATVQFSGVNVQIDNGESEDYTNGEGNLVIGYDEMSTPITPKKQTGSNNLLIGGPDLSDTSYGGIVAGTANTISSPYASVLGGDTNTATGGNSTITGGEFNSATDLYSTIGGGCDNLAGPTAGKENVPISHCNPTGLESVTGGVGNWAQGPASSISGGESGETDSFADSILGGWDNDVYSRCGSVPSTNQSC